MSLVALLDLIGATDRLTLSKEGPELHILVTKPRSTFRRRWLRRATGIFSIGLVFLLLDPFLKGLPDSTAPILALVSSGWLLVYDTVMERCRDDFLQEIVIRSDGITLSWNDVRRMTVQLNFEPARVAVTTTIPVMRGAIELRERDSAEVLSLCEHTPFYQRHFAAKKIAEYLEIEMTADREPSPAEAGLIEILERRVQS